MFDKLGELTKILKDSGKMKKMMDDAMSQINTLNAIQITGESGGGMVKITMSRQSAEKIEIADEVLQLQKEIVEELILAALNSALTKLEETLQKQTSQTTQMFNEFVNKDESQ